MKQKHLLSITIIILTAIVMAACGSSPAETKPPEKPVKATPLPATPEPQKPADAPTSTPSGPVLDASGKPVLFPNDVPVPLPEDLKVYNLTYYGYQTGAMQKFVPDDVFKDKAKYSEADREKARMALQYVLDSFATQEAAQGASVNENVYSWHLLARIYAHRYYDTGDEKELETALSYYEKCREKKYAVSVADHQALLLYAGRELPEEWQ